MDLGFRFWKFLSFFRHTQTMWVRLGMSFVGQPKLTHIPIVRSVEIWFKITIILRFDIKPLLCKSTYIGVLLSSLIFEACFAKNLQKIWFKENNNFWKFFGSLNKLQKFLKICHHKITRFSAEEFEQKMQIFLSWKICRSLRYIFQKYSLQIFLAGIVESHH